MNKKKLIYKKIYYIYGNDIFKKNQYKNIIKNSIKLKFKNTTTINIVVDNDLNWKNIYEKIFFQNFFSKIKIIVINFIEKIKKLNKLIKKKFLNKISWRKINNIFIILNIEFKKNIKKIKINKFKEKYPIKFIKCIINTNKKKENSTNILKKKYLNNKIIQKFIKSLNKKNIKKNSILIKKIEKNNFNKLTILNILFKYIINNIHKFSNKKKIKIFKLIKICDLYIKKGIHISWINFNIISWYIIKK